MGGRGSRASLLAMLAAVAAGCPPPPLQRPAPIPVPPPREDLLPPSVPSDSDDYAQPAELPIGVARLARVEGMALAPQRWGDGVVFSVDVTGTRVVLREGAGMMREMPELEGGRIGDDLVADAVMVAPDKTRVVLPLAGSDGSRHVAVWRGSRDPPERITEGVWPAIGPNGSVLAMTQGPAGRGRSFKLFRPDADPLPVFAPRDGRTVSWPTLTPDGTAVVYVDAPGGLPGMDAPASIAVMRLDGSSPRTLVPDAMRAGAPSVSSDGRWVLFSARPERATSRDLYAVPIGGGEPLRLTEDPGDEEFPLAWDDGGEGTLIWVSRHHRALSVEMKELGGDRRIPLPPLPAFAAAPAVSDDGSAIVFVVPTGHDAGVWIRVARTGSPRAVFRGATAPVRPSFAGEGSSQRIVYAAPTDRGVDLFTVSATGGETPLRFTENGRVQTDAPPLVSPDGAEVAWIEDRDRARTLVAAPLAGGELRVVARDVRAFTWAPDGSCLVLREEEIVVEEAEPGDEPRIERRTVLSFVGGDAARDVPVAAHPSWRPIRVAEDGSALFVLSEIDQPRLLRIERESGDTSTVLEILPSVDPLRSGVCVDPPGRWAMVFSARTASELRSRPGLVAALSASR